MLWGGPIWIPDVLKAKLIREKLVPNEPYYRVISRLIDFKLPEEPADPPKQK